MAVSAVIAGEALLRGWHLDHHVGLGDGVPEQLALGDGALGVVGETRLDLDRDAAVLALGRIPGRAEQARSVADIAGGDLEDGVVGRGAGLRELGDDLVVRGALGQCGREDRRIGGHPYDVAFVDELLQGAGDDPLPREVVEPDADAEVGQLLRGRGGHPDFS